jgi:predicted CopG family antitoxin
MGTKTIGIRSTVYERLAAEKREDESFADTIDRLLEETRTDWRRGLGKYADTDDSEAFERVAEDSKRGTGTGTSLRTDDVLEAMGFELDERGNVLSHPEESRPDGRNGE